MPSRHLEDNRVVIDLTGILTVPTVPSHFSKSDIGEARFKYHNLEACTRAVDIIP